MDCTGKDQAGNISRMFKFIISLALCLCICISSRAIYGQTPADQALPDTSEPHQQSGFEPLDLSMDSAKQLTNEKPHKTLKNHTLSKHPKVKNLKDNNGQATETLLGGKTLSKENLHLNGTPWKSSGSASDRTFLQHNNNSQNAGSLKEGVGQSSEPQGSRSLAPFNTYLEQNKLANTFRNSLERDANRGKRSEKSAEETREREKKGKGLPGKEQKKL